MGMDPITDGETYEVTIVVEGPVNRADFQRFRDELKKFLAQFPADPAAVPPIPGIPNTHRKFPAANRPFLQVREGRGGQRRNA